MESTLKYWLWLSLRQEINVAQKIALMSEFNENAELIYLCQVPQLEQLSFSPRAIAQFMDKSLTPVDKILGDCERLGIRILTWQDSIYPSPLRGIENPPFVLYYRGNFPLVENQPTIAMIGGRECSPYGYEMASRIAYDFNQQKGLLVTGMAQGIDTAFVLGGLKSGSPMMSIVPGGLDRYYPNSSFYLYDDVATVGALVSESPPGVVPNYRSFRPRNRLLSGVSDGVFVAESGRTGGTMMTASLAKEQQRDLFVLPGDVNNPYAQGPIRLMQEYNAFPISSARDLFYYYRERYPLFSSYKPLSSQQMQAKQARLEDVQGEYVSPQSQSKGKSMKKEMSKPKDDATTSALGSQEVSSVLPTLIPTPISDFSAIEQKILRVFDGTPLDQDLLVNHTGLSAKEVLNGLIDLEMNGIVEPVGGRHYISLVELTDIPEEAQNMVAEVLQEDSNSLLPVPVKVKEASLPPVGEEEIPEIPELIEETMEGPLLEPQSPTPEEELVTTLFQSSLASSHSALVAPILAEDLVLLTPTHEETLPLGLGDENEGEEIPDLSVVFLEELEDLGKFQTTEESPTGYITEESVNQVLQTHLSEKATSKVVGEIASPLLSKHKAKKKGKKKK